MAVTITGFIRVGDSTSCGAKVISTSSSFFLFNKPVATVGSVVACRYKCRIIHSTSTVLLDGYSAAIDDSVTTRGCRCVSSLNGVSGVGNDDTTQAAAHEDAMTPDPPDSTLSDYAEAGGDNSMEELFIEKIPDYMDKLGWAVS